MARTAVVPQESQACRVVLAPYGIPEGEKTSKHGERSDANPTKQQTSNTCERNLIGPARNQKRDESLRRASFPTSNRWVFFYKSQLSRIVHQIKLVRATLSHLAMDGG